MKNNGEIKLAVCVPLSWPNVPSQFFVSYTSLFTPSNLEAMARSGVSKLWHLVDGAFPLDLCRNRLVRRALEIGATHVLFLDADMTFPNDLIVGLITLNTDVAGALYFKKSPPYQPVPALFNVKKDEQLMKPIRLPKKPGVVKCHVLGMGATMISRNVLECIHHPRFAYGVYKPTGETSITEDVTFCRKAKEAGFDIACDTRLVCGHVRQEIVGENHWEAYRSEFEPSRESRKKERRDGK